MVVILKSSNDAGALLLEWRRLSKHPFPALWRHGAKPGSTVLIPGSLCPRAQ